MFKGKYIDTYLNCKEGTKAIHIVVNIHEGNFDAGMFSKWINENGLKKKHYEEQRIEEDGDLLKVELIALLDVSKEAGLKKKIDDFLEKTLGLRKENIYISEISEKLIINSSPYYMTSSKTGEKDLLMPIYSRKHFIRSLNDLILGFGYDVIGKLTRYYYTNGLVYLGKEYLDKCQELGLPPQKIGEKNKRIIEDIFKGTYSADITNLVTREVDGKSLIKIQLKNNFFLYHPTCETRLDVHNDLLSPVISLNVRNCALLREIFAGFFEKIYYPKIHDLTHTPQLEDKEYYGFEYDYTDGNNYIFDFENPNWTPVSKTNKINFLELKSRAKENTAVRIECCKSVNQMKRYRVFIDKRTRNPVPWDSCDENAPNILPLDYLSFTLLKIGDKSIIDALSFKKPDESFYNWLAEINKIFYVFFFTEHSAPNLNNHLVKREPDPVEDVCTFYFYDREFLDFE